VNQSVLQFRSLAEYVIYGQQKANSTTAEFEEGHKTLKCESVAERPYCTAVVQLHQLPAATLTINTKYLTSTVSL
jgi:hypothetical protein